MVDARALPIWHVCALHMPYNSYDIRIASVVAFDCRRMSYCTYVDSVMCVLIVVDRCSLTPLNIVRRSLVLHSRIVQPAQLAVYSFAHIVS